LLTVKTRAKEIFEEFIDLIETDYFESALFDCLDESFVTAL
jgi:hypothetical protein